MYPVHNEHKDAELKELSLTGMRALVVGGSSGIGQAIAHGLQSSGADVAILARTEAKVEAATSRLQAEKGSARGFVGDVNDSDGLEALAEKVEREFGPIDILVNSQGTTIIKPAVEFSASDYDLIMNTNTKSVFLTCVAFGKRMIERRSGAIINIASLAGHRGWPRAAVYSISKHGVVGLTKSLAGEWAGSGVRVNAISPGFFMTELNRDKMPAERKERALARTPVSRFGEVGELAGAAVYLASPAASFVTGTVIEVDGGYLGVGI